MAILLQLRRDDEAGIRQQLVGPRAGALQHRTQQRAAADAAADAAGADDFLGGIAEPSTAPPAQFFAPAPNCNRRPKRKKNAPGPAAPKPKKKPKKRSRRRVLEDSDTDDECAALSRRRPSLFSLSSHAGGVQQPRPSERRRSSCGPLRRHQ